MQSYGSTVFEWESDYPSDVLALRRRAHIGTAFPTSGRATIRPAAFVCGHQSHLRADGGLAGAKLCEGVGSMAFSELPCARPDPGPGSERIGEVAGPARAIAGHALVAKAGAAGGVDLITKRPTCPFHN